MKNNTLFTHGCSNEGNRFTIAVTIEKSISEITATFGYSICSKNDSFSKKIGRSIAEGRSIKNPVITLKEINDVDGFKSIKTEMYNLCKRMEEGITNYKKSL